MNITSRQKTVLIRIYDFISANSYPPTVRDTARIMGFSSPRAASDHLDSLEKKGYIRRASLARSIKLTGKALDLIKAVKGPVPGKANTAHPDLFYIPLLGRIAAGEPIFAEGSIYEYIPVSKNLLGAYGADFALKVTGDSMTGDHIISGDLVMVKSQQSADNGEIVVALIDDEAVVKRFYRTERGVELKSSNPAYPPIKISKKYASSKEPRAERAGVFKILGKVVAIHRSI